MLTENFDFDAFRKDVEEALADVSKKYGIKISTGGIRYDAVSFDMTLKVVEQIDGDEDGGQAQWNYYCRKYDLDESDYGQKVLIDGDMFKLVGIRATSRKYPIIVKRVSDGVLKAIPTDYAKYLLKK